MGSRREIDVDAHVAECLKRARKTAGLSQQNLADAVGVTHQQIGKYEGRKSDISIAMLFKLARALKLSIVDLLPMEADIGKK